MEQSEINVRSLYETHARSCDPKDFQSQVLRTPHGKPVSQDQVELIVQGIAKGLEIRSEDVLLDLCCGNGVITNDIFEFCRGGVGVDFTPYLIEVAKENFEALPNRLYQIADVLNYVETTKDTGRITKAMCYGAFQCLLESKAIAVLQALNRRFPNLQRVVLGNLPDLDRVETFFREDCGCDPPMQDLRRHDKPFGIWRTVAETMVLTAKGGWHTEIYRMPPPYFCAHYRFDAILTRY